MRRDLEISVTRNFLLEKILKQVEYESAPGMKISFDCWHIQNANSFRISISASYFSQLLSFTQLTCILKGAKGANPRNLMLVKRNAQKEDLEEFCKSGEGEGKSQMKKRTDFGRSAYKENYAYYQCTMNL